MSIHVCKCDHNGRTEYHLRYPGMTQEEAQRLADKINGGAMEALAIPTQQSAVDGWQPIETAPKDGTKILAYIHIDDGDIGVMKWMDFGSGLAAWVWDDELMGEADPDPYQPTHWMSLPPNPDAIDAAMRKGKA